MSADPKDTGWQLLQDAPGYPCIRVFYIFQKSYSTFPLCSPHRASLLTGKYPFSCGMWTNCKVGLEEKVMLRPQEICISDVLKDTFFACNKFNISIQRKCLQIRKILVGSFYRRHQDILVSGCFIFFKKVFRMRFLVGLHGRVKAHFKYRYAFFGQKPLVL